MRRVVFSLVSLCALLQISAPVFKTYDVCVYGGSASGVCASIEAARMGAKVLLVCQDGHVGGLATSGLTATDINKHSVVGGIAEEFYKRIYSYYLDEEAWHNQSREQFMESTKKRTFSGKNDSRRMQWVYESGVGERIMKDMLEESGVEILYNSHITLTDGVELKNGKIKSIRTLNGIRIRAKVFVDASYEGDLMAQAGVSYVTGREAVSKYGETLAGIRNHGMIKGPACLEDGSMIPKLAPSLYGEYGEGDNRTQAYCYRVTLTDDPDNMIPLRKPEGYDPAMFEMVLRRIESDGKTELKDVITFTPMPNRKTDTNHLDFIGGSFDYPEGDYQTRQEIAEEHRLYAEGMLWFLGHDERVPETMRQEMARWGWPKDEFTDNGHFPHQLYIRESRRMLGEYVMTQHNIEGKRNEEITHPVGMGSYPMDCHFVSYVAQVDSIMIEGGIFVPTKPYQIDYAALIPREEECSNLLVSVCLSASHVAYSSIRMEPVYMVLGQSCGTAAAMAAKSKCSVQKIDRDSLVARLRADGQILEYNVNTKTK